MWSKIVDKLSGLPYFGVSSVAQLLTIENEVAGQLLSRWVKNGKVMRIKRGIYMSREYYDRHLNEWEFLGLLSSIINPNSYLSKEYVLQKYGVMTESVMAVTAVTTKNTSKIASKMGSFLYYHIKSELFGGYTVKLEGGIEIKEATAGKALFDYLYFRPHGWAYGDKKYDLVEDLRLNLYDFEEKDRLDFINWVSLSKSKKMSDALENIRRKIWLS
jgi:predicted transcriptional regulator of viral defense system